MRDALFQRWFVVEVRAVGQMPSRKGLVEVLFQCLRVPVSIFSDWQMEGLPIIVSVLLVGLGCPEHLFAWTFYFFDVLSQVVPARVVKSFPCYVIALNEYGWSTPLVSLFIRQLSPVAVACGGDSPLQPGRHCLLSVFADHLRHVPADPTAYFQAIGEAVVESTSGLHNVDESKYWLAVTVTLSEASPADCEPKLSFLGRCISHLLRKSVQSGLFTMEVVAVLHRSELLLSVWRRIELNAVISSFRGANGTDYAQYAPCKRFFTCQLHITGFVVGLFLHSRSDLAIRGPEPRCSPRAQDFF